MNDTSVTETTVWRAASEVAAGDRIAAGFLPDGDPAEVLFTTTYRLSANREPFVLVVYRADDSDPDDYHFRADSRIPLAAAAGAGPYGVANWRAPLSDFERRAGVVDPTGLDYTLADSEPDDPTPVSPGRVPLHTGAVVDGGQLVDETRGWTDLTTDEQRAAVGLVDETEEPGPFWPGVNAVDVDFEEA